MDISSIVFYLFWFYLSKLIPVFQVQAKGTEQILSETFDTGRDFGFDQDDIVYQAHSYNDLRQWDSLLLNKKVRHFKVDLHFVEQEATCSHSGQSSPCFVLSHDTPLLDGRVRYNTSNDLIDYLQVNSPALLSKLTIQLCFKGAHSLRCDKPEWSLLVDNVSLANTSSKEDCLTKLKLFKRAVNLPETVEFMLDGIGKPSRCLMHKWRPWKSVWISDDLDSPAGAFFSGNPLKGYDRFVQVNDRVASLEWDVMEEFDFGRFREIDYPYTLWEPGSEAVIQGYINRYHSYKRHEAGFMFAMNIDKSMFSLFSNTNGHASFEIIRDYSKKSYGCPALVKSEGLSKMTDDQDRIQMLILPQKQTLSYLLLRHDRRSVTPGNWQVEPPKLLVTNFNTSISSSVRVVNSAMNDIYHIYGRNGEHVIFRLDGNESVAAVEREVISPPEQHCKELLAVKGNNLQQLWNCGTEIQITLSTSKNSRARSSYIFKTPVRPISADFIPLHKESNDFSLLVVYADIKNEIYAALIKSNAFTAHWKRIGVGSNPRLDMGKHNKNIALVVENGYCFNSEMHNKRQQPKVCDSVPESTSLVLDYTMGFIRDWSHHLLKSANSSIITGCSPSKLSHGSYNFGSCPDVAVKKDVLFVVHQSPIEEMNGAASRCGRTSHKDSIVGGVVPVHF